MRLARLMPGLCAAALALVVAAPAAAQIASGQRNGRTSTPAVARPAMIQMATLAAETPIRRG